MKLRNYKGREETLLRVAPYADLAKIRASLCVRIEKYLNDPICRFSEESKEQWKRFIAGEIHVAPRSTLAMRFMDRALVGECPEYCSDLHHSAAYHEFCSYFFYSDSDLGLREDFFLNDDEDGYELEYNEDEY